MAQQLPVFYLLAGPNGAGKSSLYKALVRDAAIEAGAEFVNADLHEASHLGHITDPEARSEQARIWADTRRAELLQQGRSFVSETVFSHESKLALVQQAQEKGFFVMLYVVALDNPQRLLARVAQRVTEGGHPVPADRVLSRYPRTLANLAIAVRQADAAVLYDSGDIHKGSHQLVAYCKGAVVNVICNPLPAWARLVLDQTND